MRTFFKYLKIISVLFLLIGLSCYCVEPFETRSISYARAIVVDGRITDKESGNYVKLSYTRPIDQQRNDPLVGATVWVEASDGSRIAFSESSPGYYSCADGVSAEAGLEYQLFFSTSDGRSYQSRQHVLLASPPIDSIYDVYAERTSSRSGDVRKGIQFFVDTHDDSHIARNFRYEWEETYEVRAPYPSMYEFFPDPDTVIARSQEYNICYVSAESTRLSIASTANLASSRLSEMPIRYLSDETDHLRYAYSILVKQYAISANAYGYYRKLLENNESNESLFEKQLGAIVGNITSVESPEETVLGYFEVSGVTENRVFFRYIDLDRRFPWPSPIYACDEEIRTIYDPLQPLPYKLVDSVEYYANSGYQIITAVYCDSLARDPGTYCFNYFIAEMVPKVCSDCRFRGPITKPDFWIY